MSQLLERASYALSAHNARQLPEDIGSEVAFAGRSNAGKSSALNALTRRKTLFDLQLTCSPCFQRECPRKDQPLACLTGIAPDAVADAVLYSLN